MHNYHKTLLNETYKNKRNYSSNWTRNEYFLIGFALTREVNASTMHLSVVACHDIFKTIKWSLDERKNIFFFILPLFSQILTIQDWWSIIFPCYTSFFLLHIFFFYLLLNTCKANWFRAVIRHPQFCCLKMCFFLKKAIAVYC